MFEGDFVYMRSQKIPLMSMGGRAEGPAWADPGVAVEMRFCKNKMYLKWGLFLDTLYLTWKCNGFMSWSPLHQAFDPEKVLKRFWLNETNQSFKLLRNSGRWPRNFISPFPLIFSSRYAKNLTIRSSAKALHEISCVKFLHYSILLLHQLNI